jgi:hypothetical protein
MTDNSMYETPKDTVSVQGNFSWLTPDNRSRIYAALIAVLTVLLGFGLVSQEQSEMTTKWFEASWQVLSILGFIMASMHVKGANVEIKGDSK